VSPEESASLAAKAYYDELLAGHYDEFLDARVGIKDIPASYREQLLASLKQFVAQQQEAHGDFVSAELSSQTPTRMDSTLHVMQVFLVLGFADSTREEIVVPMVEHDGKWRMR